VEPISPQERGDGGEMGGRMQRSISRGSKPLQISAISSRKLLINIQEFINPSKIKY
jgi:hypothetical protein